jgi:hypothetical protein
MAFLYGFKKGNSQKKGQKKAFQVQNLLFSILHKGSKKRDGIRKEYQNPVFG